MSEQEELRLRLKAEAFDRLVEKYQDLKGDDGFYSKNWVELSDFMEQEIRQLIWITGADPSLTDR